MPEFPRSWGQTPIWLGKLDYSTKRLTIGQTMCIFNRMVEQTAVKEQHLSRVLKAVGDATRRSLLTTVVQQGPTRVTDLARAYAMSLNAVSKHIKVLEAAGLVTRQKNGRIHLIAANMTPLNEVEAWFKTLRSIWALRLEKLETILTEEQANE